MNKHKAFSKILLLVLAGLSLGAGRGLAAELELYMDSETKQLFAEPGPNRIALGTFRSVSDSEENVAQATNQPATADLPVLRLEQLEQRMVGNETALAQVRQQQVNQIEREHWTDSFGIRGYLQTRYTTMLGGDEGINLWPDRSVGDDTSLKDADKNLLIRRARLVFHGDVGERLSFYIQPDLASTVGGTGHGVQMRDAYGDLYLSKDRVHRLRVGQSKVPFGFENTQSSSNRLALDRNDALNSAVRDERDLGVFYYYTPGHVQARFREIAALGLKHSGNYGMFGFGVYNGQGANRGDRNDNQHTVVRLTYPWRFDDGQFFEAGIQAYSGRYVPSTAAYRGADDISRIAVIPEQYRNGYDDERIAISALWYPQPFGLQAEWNWGRSPQLDLATNTIGQGSVNGGYIQAMFKLDGTYGTFLLFLKWQYFDGANKGEANAPVNNVNDFELGLEWLIAPEVELTAVWHHMHRNNLVTGNREGRPDYLRFDADALRLQLQYNY